MSVGDIKGARRRTKQLKAKGHFPRPSYSDAHTSIARERAKAQAEARRAAGKKSK